MTTSENVRIPLDADALRHAFSHHPSGVVAVCAEVDGQPFGLAASTFVPVSLDPPLVSLCIRTESTTWPTLRRAPRLGISVLSAAHEVAARALSGAAADRFRGVATEVDAHGALFITDALVTLGVVVVDDMVAGDHSIVVCRVHEVLVRDGVPLLFHRSRLRALT